MINIKTTSLLAIVIPYYKFNFIKETLHSIQKQTNGRFTLYIGDDNSPYSLESYIKEIDKSFTNSIRYVRFPDNMGSASIIKQWERCIALTEYEPYIWLFSDDDLMPSDAVERFYNLIENNNIISIARFNIEIINDKSVVIKQMLPHPLFETAEQFIKRRLNAKCISTACEYIFSRKIYKSKKGFVDFPLAWAADDATWAFFAEDSGIITIPGNPVSWRMSGQNISSDTSTSYQKKVEASILFIEFVNQKFYVTNKEKFTWLQGQLYLLKPSSQIKKKFYKEISRSGLFNKFYIIGFLIKQSIRNNWKRMLQRL